MARKTTPQAKDLPQNPNPTRFYTWYSALPRENGFRSAVRDYILKVTGIGYQSFYNYLHRTPETQVNAGHRLLINTVAHYLQEHYPHKTPAFFPFEERPTHQPAQALAHEPATADPH